jgi:hypothetical protein
LSRIKMLLRQVASHPNRKNKNAARVGHPIFLGLIAQEFLAVCCLERELEAKS